MSFPRLPVDPQPRAVARAINHLLGRIDVTLVDAVDDAAAATAGVKIGEFYRNGSVVMQRVS